MSKQENHTIVVNSKKYSKPQSDDVQCELRSGQEEKQYTLLDANVTRCVPSYRAVAAGLWCKQTKPKTVCMHPAWFKIY